MNNPQDDRTSSEAAAGADQGSTAAAKVLDLLASYGDEIYAYAVTRVESADVAEELVQETFLAAVKNYQQFAGRSAPKTWLMAILRHKLIGHYRSRRRKSAQPLDEATEPTYFDRKGGWRTPPGNWPATADAGLENEEFWRTFRECMSKLPGPLAELFVLRVMDGHNTENICKALKITPTNFAVRLHRARLALRDCLGKHWFGED